MSSRTALVLCWHPEPPYSGGSYNCQAQSFPEVANSQYRLCILDKEGSQLGSIKSKDIFIREYRVPSGIQFVRRKISFAAGRLLEWGYLMPALLIKGGKIIRSEKPEVIYLPIAESNQLTLVAKVLGNVYNLPVVGMIHQLGMQSDEGTDVGQPYTHTSLYSRFERWYISFLRRGLLRRLRGMTRVMSISESLVARLGHDLKREVLLIPYAFERGEYTAVDIQEKIYDAIFVGRLIPGKGIEDAIEVWKRVVMTTPGAVLAIVGSGSERYTKQIKQEIDQAGLNGNVVLLGQVTGGDKVKRIKQSKCFLFLSRFESYASVITEALACELPIVCYKLPAYEARSLMSNMFYMFDIGDDLMIANQVSNLISNNSYERIKVDISSIPDWQEFAMLERKGIFNV